VDADIAAVTDRIKTLETKLGFGTDAFTPIDFTGAVFLRLGDPIDIFLLSRSAWNSLNSATTFISLLKSFLKRSLVANQITVYFNVNENPTRRSMKAFTLPTGLVHLGCMTVCQRRQKIKISR